MAYTPSAGYIAAHCPWMKYALQELGVTEQSSGTNARIIEYFRTIKRFGIHQDETPWCAAFMWWCMVKMYPELEIPRNAAAARSFLHFGVSLGAASAAYGGLVVFRGLSVDTPSGYHCSFYCGPDTAEPGKIICLGGNQSQPGNSGCVCYKSYPASKVRDIRWPTQAAMCRTA